MKRTTRSLLIFVGFLLIGAGLYSQRWSFYDWNRLRNYSAPAPISQLADQTTMTPYARRLFYVYHPKLESSTAFNQNCSVTKQAIVLGCMVNMQGIYIFNITDPELNGVEQVTAAHEMLHVAYSRLSARERGHIDRLVLETYNRAKVTDPELEKEANSYITTEGQGVLANELHSVIGTEVADLEPELARYYARYFTDQSVIIRYKTQYQSAFTARRKAIAEDDKQLATWQITINANQTSIKRQQADLNTQRDNLTQQLSNGQFAAYNQGVRSYNQAVANFNELLRQTQSLVDQYNALVATRNDLAKEIDNLAQTLSSQPLNNAQSPAAI